MGKQQGSNLLLNKISKVYFVVGVAQLVEPRIVIPVVVGSSPIVHPKVDLQPISRLGMAPAISFTVCCECRRRLPRRPSMPPRNDSKAKKTVIPGLDSRVSKDPGQRFAFPG